MGKVISVRINQKLEEIIKNFAKEQKSEQSEVIRDLIQNGSIFLAIKGYAEGKFSIGKAASLIDVPLSELMDIITDLGIKAEIGIEDVVEGFENLKNLIK
ncbi:unnamed protein product [marine sediment metagenome]|uniref:Ribbon-helix-helix protein CopG domain-containing protein n=1 Tax=marine sediment metagenome TaxID=412755 RepID=X1FWF0_9ZZZZ